MKILNKIVEFFIKTKKSVQDIKDRVNRFVLENKEQIKLLMTILEVIFPVGTGAKKMACVVGNICSALGYGESDVVSQYVENKCQEVYNEFKSSL